MTELTAARKNLLRKLNRLFWLPSVVAQPELLFCDTCLPSGGKICLLLLVTLLIMCALILAALKFSLS